MSENTKRTLLFITQSGSSFDAKTPAFNSLFAQVNVMDFEEGSRIVEKASTYDIVIGDLSIDPEKVGVLKQIKDNQGNAIIFAMVDPKDTEKLFKIADMGINAFELLPEQFEMALQEIARYNPDIG